MKVTELKTLLLDNIEPYRGGPKWLLIELHTDEGLVGLGERVTGHSLNLRSQIELLHDLCDRFVIGQDPFNIEKIWQACYATLHDYRHPGMSHTPAISAIEMALWDIVGKATGQPIYNLLGGRYHEQLRAYAYMPSDGVWEDPPLAGRIAETLVAEGNSACEGNTGRGATGELRPGWPDTLASSSWSTTTSTSAMRRVGPTRVTSCSPWSPPPSPAVTVSTTAMHCAPAARPVCSAAPSRRRPPWARSCAASAGDTFASSTA